MLSCGVWKVFRDWCLRTNASETCFFTWSVLKLAQIGTWFSLREKCPSMEFFLVRIFPQLGWIRRDTKYWVRMQETFHAAFCIIIYSFACQFSLANSVFSKVMSYNFPADNFLCLIWRLEQEWVHYFNPLAWSLFSTQSNICNAVFFRN